VIGERLAPVVGSEPQDANIPRHIGLWVSV
jgi:hypothetical protein